jgi:hypothetical protein
MNGVANLNHIIIKTSGGFKDNIILCCDLLAGHPNYSAHTGFQNSKTNKNPYYGAVQLNNINVLIYFNRQFDIFLDQTNTKKGVRK